jgi:hypothetical protein
MIMNDQHKKTHAINTCRGNDTSKIIGLLVEYGPMEVADICKKMKRGTRYVCSLIEISEALHYTLERGRKRDYVVWYDPHYC